MAHYFNKPIDVEPGDTLHVLINKIQYSFNNFKFNRIVKGVLIVNYPNITGHYLF
jgi:hypothetical protein